MSDQGTHERVRLGNHAHGYECRTCYALAASEFAAKKHAEWHTDRGECEDGAFGDPQIHHLLSTRPAEGVAE